MATMAGTLLWLGFTMFIATAWCFPDTAIGKKYILARSKSGGYALVPDGSNVPGIPVSRTDDIHQTSTKTVTSGNTIKPRLPRPSTATRSKNHPITVPTDHSSVINLPKGNNGASNEENIVTLALQGRDGVNGRRGPKGPPGESGRAGEKGPPGLNGEPGTCRTAQFQCDISLLKTLTTRIVELEKICSKSAT